MAATEPNVNQLRLQPLKLGGTSLAMCSCACVQDADAFIDLTQEGGAEDAEVPRGHAHALGHPM